MSKQLLSIMIPCYNEEDSLPELLSCLSALVDEEKNYDFEILFVDDGSRDRTRKILLDKHNADNRFCYLGLSRNFGKEAALLAGFDYVRGDAVVMMDADLQHPPRVVHQMIRAWEEGYLDVYGKRRDRKENGWLRRKLSNTYYRLLEKTTRVEMIHNAGDFRLLDRKCIDALKELRESQRYTKGMYSWIGFRKKEILFDVQERKEGKSSWSYYQLFNLAIDGLTSFSILPLRIATVIGIFFSIVSFCYMVYVFVKAAIWGDPVQGFPTIIVLILFLGGIILLSLGVIGEYIGKTYMEVKRRPVYFVDEYVK